MHINGNCNHQSTFSEFPSTRETISTAATDFMAPEDLHCTSHVSPGPDEPYEECWLKMRFEELTLTHIYWARHKCAILVSLTPAQSDMYTMDHSVP